MPTNPNMVAIQTVTVGSGGAASIDFTSIPQTYTDLVVKVSARATVDETQLELQFNGSTSGYSIRRLTGDGSNAASASLSSVSVMQFGRGSSSTQTASTFGNTEIYIPNYTSSNNKSTSSDGVNENNATSANTYLGAGLWANSAAISSIKIFFNTGNFAQYSTATLYGVLNYADWQVQDGAKARGGTVYSDSSYYYHVFTSSGFFTPTQSLSCDILVVAGGGGGGGSNGGGGGGAGGVVNASAQSLTATSYAVTVGAGGAASSDGTNSSFASTTALKGQAGSASGAYGGGGSGTYGSGSGVGRDQSAARSGGIGTSGQGNNGGGIPGGGLNGGGGGGGAGAAGNNGGGTGGASDENNTSPYGDGGIGTNTYSTWLTATGLGSGGYIAGGGGGAGYQETRNAAGGSGGGGRGSMKDSGALGATAGTVSSGSGGGGGGNSTNFKSAGQSGGSGVVIVRYAK